jgi:hypothetical protein
MRRSPPDRGFISRGLGFGAQKIVSREERKGSGKSDQACVYRILHVALNIIIKIITAG